VHQMGRLGRGRRPSSRLLTRAGLGAVASLLIACRTVAEYEPPPLSPAPPSVLPPRATESSPVEPHSLTLREAIEEALTRGPALNAAAEVVAQARADLTTASLFPNPQLTGATTLQKLGGHFTPENPGGPPQYSIDVAQPLDPILFGKRTAAIQSAKRALDVAGADFAEAQRQRRADVAAAFFDALETRATLGLVRADLEALRRVETLTRRRLELGGAPPIDVDRARLAVASAAQDLRNAELAEVGALTTLRALLGRTAAEPGFGIQGTLEVDAPAPAPDIEAVAGIAEDQRPDVVSLKRQVARWEAEARLQRRQGLPTLQAQVGYIYQHQEPVGAPNQNEWEAAVSMSVPLFDRNQGNIAKAASQARQARYALEATRAALRAELEQAVAAFRAASGAARAEDPDQLDAARSVRERTEAAYQAGGRTILELLDAERAWRDAQRLHVRVQSAYWHALHRLNAAAGAPVLQ
jgi:outer membrane protein, heavy metal efflux system